MIKAYLVDDERPAVERLSRMLQATGRVQILGASLDPTEALAELPRFNPDVLFLDIRMPGLSGFELLEKLPAQPLVVFTTAYDEHALEAFQANSIDYLLKPVDVSSLERALAKVDRFMGQGTREQDFRALLDQLATTLHVHPAGTWLTRLASRTGGKIQVIDARVVTHLFAHDKVTFAATLERSYAIDQTIAELEKKLDPARFIRIHRGVILNLDHLLDLHTGFAGRMIVRLKDPARTELTVSRDRARALKAKLGL